MENQYKTIQTETLQAISSTQAYAYRIIPQAIKDGVLYLQTDATKLTDLRQELEILLGTPVALTSVETSYLEHYLAKYYRPTNAHSGVSSLSYSEDFLMQMIYEAQAIGSSDLHFETFEHLHRVRLRIDGQLIEKYIIPEMSYPKIINRIKIMAGLDISEKRLPQDGRISLKTSHEDFDIRVSSLPTLHGEKLVLRILSKNGFSVQLAQLGFSSAELNMYKEAIKKPNGMVLISGPTGSGKTTTLYATLKEINRVERNILTIEDPIEYTLEGINQVQLKESIGLDFASTLRTFLRQDPDIIMVGEIRDTATANMAVRAALTGHLVLSTIHTNSAWATISRLLDMGVPPFLIASTLHLSVAQRLVRKLCSHCKEATELTIAHLPRGFEMSTKLTHHYTPKGCSACYQTGFKGRKAIYEIIPISSELVDHIQHKTMDIGTYLSLNNIATLQENAWQMVVRGETTIEEIYSLLLV